MRYADTNMARPTGLKNEQVIFANRIAEKVRNGKRLDLPQLAAEAGYLEDVNVKKELRNPRFKEYLAEQLTDAELVDTHKALLCEGIKDQTRLNAVRLGYEIKGYLGQDVRFRDNHFNIGNVSWSDNTLKPAEIVETTADVSQLEE